MLDIPSCFVISSRLSTLDSKEVVGIIQLAGKKWNENQVLKRMNKYPVTPIIGVGISNPQELSRVISGDIPVMHIQDDCKALQAVQKRNIRNSRLCNRFVMMNSASLWGLFIHKMINNQGLFKRGQDIIQVPIFETGNLPIPNYIVGICTISITFILSWITKRILFNKIRNEYEYYMENNQVILIRNDVLYSKTRYIIQTLIPYCFIGLSVYHFKKHLVAHK